MLILACAFCVFMLSVAMDQLLFTSTGYIICIYWPTLQSSLLFNNNNINVIYYGRQ